MAKGEIYFAVSPAIGGHQSNPSCWQLRVKNSGFLKVLTFKKGKFAIPWRRGTEYVKTP